MRASTALVLTSLLVSSCADGQRPASSEPPPPAEAERRPATPDPRPAPAPDDPAPAPAGIESVHTDLRVAACREEIDRSDPNETTYRVCPGTGGYSLIVRRVESGRVSVDVVDAARNVRALDFQATVTPHMMSLGDRAEWRVTAQGGATAPIAVIVRVEAREDLEEPERVTRTYLAVAKITGAEACVTDVIPDGADADARARRLADAARDRPCVAGHPR